MSQIYFDFAAAAPIDAEVWEVFENTSKNCFANPNGIHAQAQVARNVIESARREIAQILKCKSSELIFCGSATEANNLALLGTVYNARSKALAVGFSDPEIGSKSYIQAGLTTDYGGDENLHSNDKLSHGAILGTDVIRLPHILISSIEHPSISQCASSLAALGLASFSTLPTDSGGLVDLEYLKDYILPQTAIISVIWVNNEIGTIQSLQQIVEKIKLINQARLAQNLPKVLLHVDASQAFLSENVDLKLFEVDLLTLSGHKIYAPRGTAILFARTGVELRAITGGGQESGRRSGTQNTGGIAAMAKAMQIAQANRTKYREKLAKLQTEFFSKLDQANQNKEHIFFQRVIVNGVLGSQRVVNNINFSLKSIDHQTLHTALDLAGFSLSGGSSCSSGSLEISSVITAIRSSAHSHLPEKEATIRLSLGRDSRAEDLNLFFEKLVEIVTKLAS